VRGAVSVLAAAGLVVAGAGFSPAVAEASPTKSAAASPTGAVTDLAHLDWLLGTVPLVPGVPGHSTYEQSSQPTALAPWVYANHNADGSFTRVGGGAITDAAKGYYAQGAYDADDIARTAVVYVRDWQQNHDAASEQRAYEVLRDLAYLQTTSGPDAGDVVLWQQSDGTLNPTPTPPDSPNPSDSGESFWLGRTIWAFGEAYGAFEGTDPAFASFLQQRLDLAIGALQRQSLSQYGRFEESNGVRVPAWLITGSTSASAEAALGLDAYVKADPSDARARTALADEAQGLADMASGSVDQWPFGALLSDTSSQSEWNAWGGLAPAALSDAAVVLGRPDWQKAAVADVAQFTPQLLAAGGPDNELSPTVSDASQIAYGVDSLVESSITVADNTGDRGLEAIAAIAAAWYFGANPAGVPVYNPATGVCTDGISAGGQVNLNCGAESTIHTELSMLALDAHPQIRALATSLTSDSAVDGMRTVEAESGTLTGDASVVTPPSDSTGSATWSGDAYVQAGNGSTVTMNLPQGAGPANLYPVVNRGIAPAGTTAWTSSDGRTTTMLGSTPNGGLGPQGIAPLPSLIHPLSLPVPSPQGAVSVTAHVHGDAQLDAVLVQPVVSQLALSGAASALELYVSASTRPDVQRTTMGAAATVCEYDAAGRLIAASTAPRGPGVVPLAPGGFSTVASGPGAAACFR
jgi:hypothetical protein